MILAAFDWTPLGLVLTFVASMTASILVYKKGKDERDDAKVDADAAQKVIDSSHMAELAFKSLERQAENAVAAATACEGRCERLEDENRDLRRRVRTQGEKIERQDRRLAEQDTEISGLHAEIAQLRGAP